MGSGTSQSTRAHQARVHYIVGHQVRHGTWWVIKLLIFFFLFTIVAALFNFFLLIYIFFYLYNMLLFEANVCFFFYLR